MAKKRFLLGMLVIALVFGMMVIGCEKEEDTNPSPPTGLKGTAVSPTSVKLTWNSADNVANYMIQYKQNSIGFYQNQSTSGTNTSYTVTGLIPATKYDFRIAVNNTDGYTSDYSSVISVETLPPSTGNVLLLSLVTRRMYLTPTSTYSYTINITLRLNPGTYWNSSASSGDTAKSWVTITGSPDVSSWTFLASPGLLNKNDLDLTFSKTDSTQITISSLSVSIDQNKLTEMKGYTNATTSITVGSPSSASSSEWAN